MRAEEGVGIENHSGLLCQESWEAKDRLYHLGTRMHTLPNPGNCSKISHFVGKRLMSLAYQGENDTYCGCILPRARQFCSVGSSCASLGSLPKCHISFNPTSWVEGLQKNLIFL